MIIAIDGPAGAGKSTIAKKLAEKLSFYYVNSGAMYRAYTYVVLEKGISVDDKEKIEKFIKDYDLNLKDNSLYVNDIYVEDKIYNKLIDVNAPKVSSVLPLRKKVNDFILSLSNKRDIVVEGRDMTTRVFPNAEIKVFLDASIEERARRRLAQRNDTSLKLGDVIKEVQARDEIDSNKEGGELKKAADAIVIDGSKMSVEAVVDYISNLVYGNK